ncbi:unnamed protein product [Pleuronectes platessa]|uniref:MBD domain-containing protein n=1 Tax=Pleuronectes platessa TaxID=8262 RepID=A0A9N7VVJ1_PLEPL|nr:unnamed protein product [Pleuronectes platessa]
MSQQRHLYTAPEFTLTDLHENLKQRCIMFTRTKKRLRSRFCGSGKTSGVTDERVLKSPLEFGWQRETRIRSVAGRLQGEVAYFAPCGKILRRYPDVTKYLVQNGIMEIARDNFSFSPKVKVGAFYEAREGPEEKEMQRLQAVMRKQLETEKRRQDIMLIKAEENRKKAEEKERVKQEKTEEKRLNKERSLQLKRLALAKAKALKKPNKDMCLADLKCSPKSLVCKDTTAKVRLMWRSWRNTK